ncbi:TetR/AcrR family transcriptional regulator [Pseudomonas sp. BJa5]|uniref:TetR/AcrR family transcriptional regulator n=1 Tax=Pseudomonas sp. BJa5 TaxID=2936270 RepID=UPI00255A022A|nr:TetR/AcrR family transcriptional regulator [Pseudomonas sp. BGr12]MDL2419863.1 TetR/AcrR family transcriptional regulator [Pseudomonas sp. BGr12]
MRYATDHKEHTRQKLLESSGALAKRGGFNATGVAGLMKAIGLTGGAFYNHFPSKDDLFTEIVRRELSHSPMAQQPIDRERLGRCLEQYLTLAHVHNREGGCAIPALGAEIAQAPLPVREEAEHWLCNLQQAWAQTLGDPDLAWALLSQCVGALLIARMLASEARQQEVLKASRDFLAGALHESR